MTAQRGIPALAVGIPFLLAASLCLAQAPLALELFREGNWPAAARESRRVLAEHPSNDTARLIESLALVRRGEASDQTAALLENPALSLNVPPDLGAMAAFEAGCARWRRGDPNAAFRWFRLAFENPAAGPVFARSGAALAVLLEEYPKLADDNPSLPLQLSTCAVLWKSVPKTEILARPAGKKTGLLSKPGEWIVSFYRRVIAPAIGARCSLSPGCSQYFLQAARERGLLAFPLIADRLVREPGVVAQARKPVSAGESVRYADPLSDHVPWLENNE
jgi:putative component of membrane protein insertase Oxa1/YidC/SpoIIIJ protein YidD